MVFAMGNLLSDIFGVQAIRMNLEGKTKDAVFGELIGAITDLYPECNAAEMLAEITEREDKMTTGIGSGIAIPHAYCNSIENLTGAMGISRQGIDFGASDNKPVHVVFLLAISKKKKENHLRVLNMILQLAQSNAIDKIKTAKTVEEIHDILSQGHL